MNKGLRRIKKKTKEKKKKPSAFFSGCNRGGSSKMIPRRYK